MGRREVVKGKKLNAAKSLASAFTSNTTTVVSMDNIGINVTTSGVTTNTGSFYVQHRVKYSDDPSQQSGWATLTLDSTPILANADTSFLINLNQLPPGEIRLGFTPAGGTPNGTCDIWLSGCSVGA